MLPDQPAFNVFIAFTRAHQPTQDYADKEALGLPASGWCARVADANGTARGPCTKGPTVAQLLRMTGGIVDVSEWGGVYRGQ